MKDILALVAVKQFAYARSPLFEFMQNTDIHPVKRLAFAPCAAPFIMSFADLCRYTLRQEPTNDRIQMLLNQHTYEDDLHWQWFLEDLQELGFNHLIQLNDSLKFLWSQDTRCSRFLSNELYQNIVRANTLGKWTILEVMEAAADVFLTQTRKVTQEIEAVSDRKFKYFGNCHLNAENDHTAHSEDATKLIENMQLSDRDKRENAVLVDTIFNLFSQWNLSLLTYAKAYEVSPLLSRSSRLEASLAI